MYDTFKEKKQYNLLMQALQQQNQEYMELNNKPCVKKEAERVRIKYSLTHLDLGMAKRHIKRKIATKKLKTIEKRNNYKMPDMENHLNTMEPNYFSKERIAVYTVMFGGYDYIREPLVSPDNVDFYIITDMEEIPDGSVWVKFDDTLSRKCTDKLDAGMKNRWYKTHPHMLFPDYEYSLYVDSSIKIITDITEHINKIGQTGISIHSHSFRDCVYDEWDVVRCYGLDDIENLMLIKKVYDDIKLPRHYGLSENTIIARRHNDESVISIMEDWWRYIENYCRRDQLSLMVVLYQRGIKTAAVCGLGNNIRENPAFRWEAHKGHYGRVKNGGS